MKEIDECRKEFVKIIEDWQKSTQNLIPYEPPTIYKQAIELAWKDLTELGLIPEDSKLDSFKIEKGDNPDLQLTLANQIYGRFIELCEGPPALWNSKE